MSAVEMNLAVGIEELTLWTEELIPDTTSGQTLLVLLCAVAALLAMTRSRGAISPYDRQRVRASVRTAMTAGVTEAALVDGIRRLTGEAVRRASGCGRWRTRPA